MMLDPSHAIVLCLVIGGWLVFWALAVTSIARHVPTAGSERILWIVLAIAFPFIGPLIWFAWGRPHYLNRQQNN